MTEDENTAITGKSVLVVEDESLVAMFIEDTLADLGCSVAGFATHFADALEKARTLSFDVAILDVNLNGQQTFPIAELLAGRGVPFVFATGYGMATVPDGFESRPIVQKPFQERELARALAGALAGA